MGGGVGGEYSIWTKQIKTTLFAPAWSIGVHLDYLSLHCSIGLRCHRLTHACLLTYSFVLSSVYLCAIVWP